MWGGVVETDCFDSWDRKLDVGSETTGLRWWVRAEVPKWSQTTVGTRNVWPVTTCIHMNGRWIGTSDPITVRLWVLVPFRCVTFTEWNKSRSSSLSCVQRDYWTVGLLSVNRHYKGDIGDDVPSHISSRNLGLGFCYSNVTRPLFSFVVSFY